MDWEKDEVVPVERSQDVRPETEAKESSRTNESACAPFGIPSDSHSTEVVPQHELVDREEALPIHHQNSYSENAPKEVDEGGNPLSDTNTAQVVPETAPVNDTLFGREVESGILNDAYQRRFVSNSNEIVLVSGASGTGKTWLISETLKKRGMFCSGKFDQLQRPEPFAPFVAAMTEFATLMKPEDIIATKQRHRERLKELDPQLLLHMIPALDVLLDEGSSTTDSVRGSDDGDNSDHRSPRDGDRQRFLVTLTKFLRIVCPDFQLVLFLDDLQWADSGSLELFHMLATKQPKGLVLIGACRGNEVSINDDLAVTLRSLDSNGVMITEVQLRNFDVSGVTRYIAQELKVSADDDDCRALGRMMYRQSEGNIFFVKRYLINMFDQNAFCHDGLRYTWDQAELEQYVGTKSIVELVSIDLKRVHKDRTEVMKTAACLGASFDEKLLSYVIPKELVAASVDALIETKLLSRERGQLFFAHDQLQKACYGLIEEDDRAAFHLELGKNLHTSMPEKLLQKYLFVVASQVVRGASAISKPSDRPDLAFLCLDACKEAVALASFGTAAAYVDAGIDILGERAFQVYYPHALALYNAGAEIAYCSGETSLMQDRVDAVLTNARTLHDKMQAYTTQMVALGTSQDIESAMRLGFHVLRSLGERIARSANPLSVTGALVKTKLMLKLTTPNKIMNLPPMTNQKKIAAMKILDLLFLYAFLDSSDFVPLLCCRHVQLTLQYGVSAMSASGFTMYSIVLSSLSASKREAYNYGSLGFQLGERYANRQWSTRIKGSFYGMVSPWREPIRNSLEHLKRAYYSGQRSGDFEFAALSAFFYTINALTAGCALGPLMEEMLGFREMYLAYGQDTALTLLTPFIQSISLLLGEPSDDPLKVTGKYMDEAEELRRNEENNNSTANFAITTQKVSVARNMGEYSVAERVCKEVRKYQGRESIAAMEISFEESAVALALYQETTASRHLRVARKGLRHLRKCAREVPHNALDMVHFLEAEYAAVKGDITGALTFYQLATSIAAKEGFLHREAQYCERKAVALRLCGREKESIRSMKRARDLYEKWGAVIVVDRIDNSLEFDYQTR